MASPAVVSSFGANTSRCSREPYPGRISRSPGVVDSSRNNAWRTVSSPSVIARPPAAVNPSPPP
ncbi:hypothetical protein GCM10029963_16910 [Micromonospora andamanensis]